MNTNLADLGASVSVVTKQQFEDTASTDINDIFRYEVNTEGSLTYTPGTQSMRNDGVLDVNAGTGPDRDFDDLVWLCRTAMEFHFSNGSVGKVRICRS